MSTLFNYPKFKATDTLGNVLVGGKVYTYIAGTTTPKATYQDKDSLIQNSNPVILDANGEATIYFSTGRYKVVLKNALDATIWTLDNLTGLQTQVIESLISALSFGDGSYTDETISAALAAIGTSTQATLVLLPGTWVIDENVDWSAYTNVTLRFERGAILSHGTNTVVLANVEADQHYQLFDGTGLVTITNNIEFFPQWWGALGDGTADDAAAIQKCFNSAYVSKAGVNYEKRPIVRFMVAAKYRIDSAVTCLDGIDLIMDSPIVYYGTANETALTFGSTSVYNLFARAKIRIYRNAVSDWTNEASIGVKIINAYHGNIEIAEARLFTINVQLYGGGSGENIANIYTMGLLGGGKVQLDLVSAATVGCNSNIIKGGHYVGYSGVHNDLSRYGIRISGTYKNNHNVFEEPIIELRASAITGGAEAVPVIIEAGTNNHIVKARGEGNSTTFARVSLGSTGNMFGIAAGANASWGTYTISDANPAKTNLLFVENLPETRAWHHIYSSGPMHLNAHYYNATNVNIPNVMIQYSSTTFAPAAYVSAAGAIISDTNVELGTVGAGVYVDTSEVKSFVIRTDCIASFGGRIRIVAFDVNGAVMTDAGTTNNYIQNTLGNLAWSTAYGGSYGNQADRIDPMFFSVHNDVKKIFIMVASGTAALKIRSFDLYSADPQGRTAAVWTENYEPFAGARIATISPTRGTMYMPGQIVYNAVPAALTTPAWHCVFRLDTTLAEEVSALEKMTIDITSVTGVAVTDIVGILLDDGTFYWDTVAGIVGSSINLSGAGPASVASNGNFVIFFRFKPEAILSA